MSEYSVKRVRLQVVGVPAPKGSARAMPVRGARGAVLVPSGSQANKEQLSTWRSDVILACRRFQVPSKHPIPVFHPDSPLSVGVVFRIPARVGDLRADRVSPRPSMTALSAHGRDVDKLIRSTYDAITQSARIWLDDARVAVGPPMRRYVLPGSWQGAEILISYDAGEVIRWFYDQWKKAEKEIADAKAKHAPPPSPQQEMLR